MSALLSVAESSSAVPGFLHDDWEMPLLARQYAEQTRDFLGVPAEMAFSLNDTAAAAVAAMMARCGMMSPPGRSFCPRADEPAEVTLYNAECQVLARITFDTRQSASMDDIGAWLERVRSGDRLLDFGVHLVHEPALIGDMAHAIAERLWDALIG